MILVAPRAGAWIETQQNRYRLGSLTSPPARGRGLKPIGTALVKGTFNVAPRAGAWIETKVTLELKNFAVSPPARGRGLKLTMQKILDAVASRPSRGGVD